MPADPTWQQSIADAARSHLTEHGAVIVILAAGEPPYVVSRLYRREDYAVGKMLSVVWAQATRTHNEMTSDTIANVYVVTRDSECVRVWTGPHSILGSWLWYVATADPMPSTTEAGERIGRMLLSALREQAEPMALTVATHARSTATRKTRADCAADEARVAALADALHAVEPAYRTPFEARMEAKTSIAGEG